MKPYYEMQVPSRKSLGTTCLASGIYLECSYDAYEPRNNRLVRVTCFQLVKATVDDVMRYECGTYRPRCWEHGGRIS